MTQNTLIYRFKNLIPEQTTPKHIIIKLFKNKGKKNLTREKRHIIYRGKRTQMT